MMIFLYILAYILTGALTMFGVMILGFRQGWDDDDRNVMNFLSWVLWPFIIPILLLRGVYQTLSAKAFEINRKMKY